MKEVKRCDICGMKFIYRYDEVNCIYTIIKSCSCHLFDEETKDKLREAYKVLHDDVESIS